MHLNTWDYILFIISDEYFLLHIRLLENGTVQCCSKPDYFTSNKNWLSVLMADSGKCNFTSVAPASGEGNIENNDAQE